MAEIIEGGNPRGCDYCEFAGKREFFHGESWTQCKLMNIGVEFYDHIHHKEKLKDCPRHKKEQSADIPCTKPDFKRRENEMKRNKLKLRNDKRVTLQQIAYITGAAYSTVASYAQRAGWTQNGVQTLLDEKQTAIIIEAMKATGGQGQNLTFQENLEGVETSESRAVRMAVLAEKRIELERKFNAELAAEIAELRAKNQTLLGENETLETALNQSLKYFTVAKYNKVYKMGWDMSQCQRIGKDLSTYCRLRNIEIRQCETNDDRFGTVNSYPVKVFEDNFGDYTT